MQPVPSDDVLYSSVTLIWDIIVVLQKEKGKVSRAYVNLAAFIYCKDKSTRIIRYIGNT
jgi:hypothetical protein